MNLSNHFEGGSVDDNFQSPEPRKVVNPEDLEMEFTDQIQPDFYNHAQASEEENITDKFENEPKVQIVVKESLKLFKANREYEGAYYFTRDSEVKDQTSSPFAKKLTQNYHSQSKLDSGRTKVRKLTFGNNDVVKGKA